ncbi:hypothetical protein GCM10009801_66970 [Streptomyces albiaxialis]|uniref:Secreted protein n=1 Tax=Streptomyces albiaxialis TaxID=329523 RepID=A0ABN2WQL5_9ACTN
MHRSLAAAVTTAALALAVAPATTAQAAETGQGGDTGKAEEILGTVVKSVTQNGLPVGLPTDGLLSSVVPLTR